MNWIRSLAFKFYAFFFAWLALSQAAVLLIPESDTHIFYHILLAFHQKFSLHYYLAWGNTILMILCLYPLFLYAFGGSRRWSWFFVPLFFLRLISETVGHSYEMLFFRSAFQSSLLGGLTTSFIAILILLPSYYAHFKYAFKKQAATT